MGGMNMKNTIPKYTVTVSKNGIIFYAEMFTTKKQAQIYITSCKKYIIGKEYKYRITRIEEG